MTGALTSGLMSPAIRKVVDPLAEVRLRCWNDILCPCLGFACESGAHRHEPHQRKSRMVETS